MQKVDASRYRDVGVESRGHRHVVLVLLIEQPDAFPRSNAGPDRYEGIRYGLAEAFDQRIVLGVTAQVQEGEHGDHLTAVGDRGR